MKVLEIIGDNASGRYRHERTACRGIVLREDRILLSHEEKTGVYMTPGGGLEAGEDVRSACAREIAEETGVLVEPSECVLRIEEYYGDWKYVNLYFFGKTVGRTEMKPTVHEIEVGMRPQWVPLDEAFRIFSGYGSGADMDEMTRGLYQREYTALKELLKKGGAEA